MIDPDGSSEGWVTTEDGAFVVNEPQGSPGWYPANDNPRDKATFDFAITVPKGITAIGERPADVQEGPRKGKTTWRWREDSPMAPYLATATNGVFELRVSSKPRRPDPALPRGRPGRGAQAGAILANSPRPRSSRSSSGLYGPYPFSSGGGDRRPRARGRLRARVPDQVAIQPDVRTLSTVVHEISHQWFGNSVSLDGLAGHLAQRGLRGLVGVDLRRAARRADAAQQAFDASFARPADGLVLDPATGQRGGPATSCSRPRSYDRGAMTLQALRVKIGDKALLRPPPHWYGHNRDGNVNTADFIRLAERRKSHQQLDVFFQTWLYQPSKPVSW